MTQKTFCSHSYKDLNEGPNTTEMGYKILRNFIIIDIYTIDKINRYQFSLMIGVRLFWCLKMFMTYRIKGLDGIFSFYMTHRISLSLHNRVLRPSVSRF